jgi:hypothetical protein
MRHITEKTHIRDAGTRLKKGYRRLKEVNAPGQKSKHQSQTPGQKSKHQSQHCNRDAIVNYSQL